MVYGGVTSVPGKFLLVMEYCPGGSLHDRLMGDGPIAEVAMRQWVFQIAAAMKYAAFRGVFHNDLKPANILLDGSDDAKVADFGLSRTEATLLAQQSSTLGGGGGIQGTPMYSAPEVLEGKPGTEASDVFSFGALTYEILERRVPWPDKSFAQVATAVLDT